MTRTTNARIAGFTFLAYIAATISSVAIFGRAASGDTTVARLASISAHAGDMHAVSLLTLVQAFAALVLAVTLYAVTRDQDRDLALFAMVCRLTEGVIGALSVSATLALFWLATTSGPNSLAVGGAHALGGYLLRDSSTVSAIFFAVGSTLFAYLFLRGRLIPVALAWLGIAASILLLVGLPAQLVNVINPSAASFMWLPMLAFEILLGLWLLIKGVGVSPPKYPDSGLASIAGDV